jgi:alpha-galactosidase
MPRASRRRFASLVPLAFVLAAVLFAGGARAAAETTELARAGDAFVLQEDGQRAWTVGNDRVSFRVGISRSGALTTLALDRTGFDGQWKPASAADFTFLVGTRRLTPGQSTFAYKAARAAATDTSVDLELVFEDTTSRIRVTRHYRCAARSAAVEVWSVFETTGTVAKVTIGDIGVWRLSLPVNAINWVTGLQASDAEGGRFTRRRQILAPGGEFELGSTTRSSESSIPAVWFSGAAGSFFGGLQWSGAWSLRVTGPAANGLTTVQFSMGDTTTTVLRNQPLEGPHGFFGVARGDQADVTVALQSYLREGVRRGRPLQPLVTYNTWFAYGTRIDEEILRKEMDRAARIGVELFVVDAGWYVGGDDVWDFSTGLGNWSADPDRFPSGLRALSDYAHGLGMKFGLWVEPERVDTTTVNDPGLAKERFLATAGGVYNPSVSNAEANSAQICLADAEARQWVLDQLVRLVAEVQPDYLKWDNNYWINCDRANHGHGTKDGNFAHVKGLYAVLGALRERFPSLSIENCATGGNRLDPGMLQYTDSAWMDDVTAPSAHVRHNLEGLGSIYPPSYLLSFVMNDAVESIHSGIDRSLEFKSRMLGILGLTWRGFEFDDEELEEMAGEIVASKSIRSAVPDAALFLLTEQARADGSSNLDAVQLSSPGARTSAVFVYANDGMDWFTIRLKGLDPETRYLISTLRGEELGEATGADLMESGVDIVNSSDSGAHVVLFTPMASAVVPAVSTVRR